MLRLAQTAVSRRDLIAGATPAGAAAISLTVMGRSEAQAQDAKRATYVLVHPAWHGGWCWKKVAPLLRARGHDVWTPTLTGLGERSHLARPEVGLNVHVEDVASVLEFEDLTGVILVGHSSTGMVITGIADRMPERLAHLVYLDAFVPENGQALLDLMPAPLVPQVKARVQEEGQGWLLPRLFPGPWGETVGKVWRITDEADQRWMLARLRPTPFRHFLEPVRRANPAAEQVPRTYIRCLQYPNPVFDGYAARARQGGVWRHRELATSHEPFVTMPRELTDLLLEIAS
jgi:pimeloyl-ACP methyl ester carboxylesterase